MKYNIDTEHTAPHCVGGYYIIIARWATPGSPPVLSAITDGYLFVKKGEKRGQARKTPIKGRHRQG